MVYKDKVIDVKNDDLINRSQWAKRMANECLKSESAVGNVSGIAAKDAETLIKMAEKFIADINNMVKGYAPATHNDITYRALLCDMSHPEVVEEHEDPSEGEVVKSKKI